MRLFAFVCQKKERMKFYFNQKRADLIKIEMLLFWVSKIYYELTIAMILFFFFGSKLFFER